METQSLADKREVIQQKKGQVLRSPRSTEPQTREKVERIQTSTLERPGRGRVQDTRAHEEGA